MRPIVAIAAAAARTKSFDDFFAAIDTTKSTERRFRRDFAKARNLQLMPHVVAAYESRRGRATIRQLMVAGNDPFFPRWEQDAKLRLAAERRAQMRPQHALAAANPEKAVVICEAGCSSGAAEIVFAAPSFAEHVRNRSAATSDSHSVSVASVDSEVSTNGAFDCIAGCYDTKQQARTETRPPPRQPAIKAFAARRVYPTDAAYSSSEKASVVLGGLRTRVIGNQSHPGDIALQSRPEVLPWQTVAVAQVLPLQYQGTFKKFELPPFITYVTRD